MRAPDSDLDDATAPTVDRDRRWLVPVSAALAAVAVIAWVTWSLTRLGDNLLASLAAVVATAVGAALVSFVARRVAPGRSRDRVLAVVATLGCGAVVVALSASGTLISARSAQSQAGWQQHAERVLAGGAERGNEGSTPAAAPPCSFGAQIAPELRQLDGFGRVDQICSSATPGFRQVAFSQSDNIEWTGLVYAPDTAEPMVSSTCVRHLDGPWWQTANASEHCPTGYEFVGGG